MFSKKEVVQRGIYKVSVIIFELLLRCPNWRKLFTLTFCEQGESNQLNSKQSTYEERVPHLFFMPNLRLTTGKSKITCNEEYGRNLTVVFTRYINVHIMINQSL